MLTVIRVDIDACVQAVATQKIVVELGAHQFRLGHHLFYERRACAYLQQWRDGVVELIVSLVTGKVIVAHVQRSRVFEAFPLLAPDEGCKEIGIQQTQHVFCNRLA